MMWINKTNIEKDILEKVKNRFIAENKDIFSITENVVRWKYKKTNIHTSMDESSHCHCSCINMHIVFNVYIWVVTKNSCSWNGSNTSSKSMLNFNHRDESFFEKGCVGCSKTPHFLVSKNKPCATHQERIQERRCYYISDKMPTQRSKYKAHYSLYIKKIHNE